MGYPSIHTQGTRVIPTRVSVECRANHITTVLNSGAWKGRRCILIGGGPSLLNFDFSILDGELTIGVNKSFTTYSSQINYAMDMRFYDMLTHPTRDNQDAQELHKKWIPYEGIKLFLRGSRKFRLDSSVYYVEGLPSAALSFDLSKGIFPGNNSGFGALMLAIALGCKRIGLLGFDLKVEKGRTHWHNGYPHQEANQMQEKLDRFIPFFEDFAPVIKQQGIEIINFSKDSKLSCFPKGDVGTFLD